jgi:pimeloyl-ACP methyl ester carboxylesterase
MFIIHAQEARVVIEARHLPRVPAPQLSHWNTMPLTLKPSSRLTPTRLGAVAVSAAAAATAVWVHDRARQAEQDHPPPGRFIHIDGVRLHYLLRGDVDQPAVVLLHGNAVTLDDFRASGLLDKLATRYTVLAFDRPGFGHSTRPRDRLWTPALQAQLLQRAIVALGVRRPPVLLGHSLGAMVALAWALDHPDEVAGLVLLGGYYYPSPRLDALLMMPVAAPVVGDVLRHTVTAVSARLLMGRTARAMFKPQPVPAHFFPTLSREMMLRPSQLRANAEDATAMVPQAQALSRNYSQLRMPVTLMVGEQDAVVDRESHTQRLHAQLSGSELLTVPRVGHMLHYSTPDAVVQALDRVSERLRSAARVS